MLSEMRLSSSVSLNSDSIRMPGSTVRDFGSMTTRTSSVELVAEFGDQRQLLVVEQLRHPLDQARLLNEPGNLRDDDLIGAAPGVLLLPSRAHAERAAAGGIGLGDHRRRVDDDAAGREIRPLDVFQQRLGARVRIVDQEQRGVAELVRRCAAGSLVAMPTAMPCRAVGEQIGERARQHDRLGLAAVVGRAEIDRVLVDAVEQQTRHLGHPRFGVAHRGRVIAVDVAEVALAVDQRIALREILREPHQRVVDRLIAVRMVFADDVADHARRLLERLAGIEPQLPHGEQQPPVHRLEPVARVGQRPVHDGGERVGEIALFQRFAQRDRLHVGRLRRNQPLSHAGSVQRQARREQETNPPAAQQSGLRLIGSRRWPECQMNRPATANSDRLGLNAWNYSHAMMLYGLYEQENWSQQPQEGPNAQNPSLADRRFRDRGSRLDRSRQRDDRWHGIGHPGRHRRHLRRGRRRLCLPPSLLQQPPGVLVEAGWLSAAMALASPLVIAI